MTDEGDVTDPAVLAGTSQEARTLAAIVHDQAAKEGIGRYCEMYETWPSMPPTRSAEK